jgi:class 3 adenylate cyclase
MIYAILGGLVLIMAIAVITYKNYREKARINKVLDKQNAEIESLILNILPKEIARELQAEGEATPRYYENVSVLFTDFKGFSSISQGMTPNELVEHLNDYFHAFDDIVGQLGLEKIKTIGDAYMCAGGIPLPNRTHPVDIVKAGLAMQEYINQRKEELAQKGEVGWDLRVGVHTGPIVAGVVGKKKYAYDIWGNTVNIASRMESNGEPGKVNISESTYKLVKDRYKCHHRGKIYAKNVGDIDMYFIEEEIPVERELESMQA